jgi:predicted 2-oxoglutarate/Fe(II)-dependent dioxygenase YbiX
MEPEVLSLADTLILPGFLSPEECSRLRLAMNGGAPEQAEVLGHDIAADETVRRAWHMEVDDASLQFVEGRLDAVRERLARHFGVPLTQREGSGFLRYPTGGLFRPHRDWAEVPSWPDAALRRVAVVIFLTTSRDADPGGTFSGGTLRLFAGEDQGSARDIHPQCGTLVAFHATVVHEVTAVREGIRDSVVDWFY